MNDLLTPWSVDPNNVLPDYPRPQLFRRSYINLNGFWEYAVTKTETAPVEFDGRILVPFSPECQLSRVRRVIMPDEYLWYRRGFALESGFNVGRVLLNFGAVDQMCKVFVNGRFVRDHVGGYLPFSCDITDYLVDNRNEIIVLVRDETSKSSLARGKQTIKHKKIWYTPQSGIWQTVWLESVPETYITGLRVTPLFDEGAVNVKITASAPVQNGRVGVLKSGKLIEAAALKDNEATLHLADFHAWTPDDPYLYDLVVVADSDRIKSYFGMRKWSVGRDIDNIPRLMLNNEPFFFNGLLDQGYWSDGLYTAPTDDALIYDIVTAKELGFNTLRKHAKIEPLRWYYHCDRLGMVVWQDMVNGGGMYNSRNILPIRHLKDGPKQRKALARTDPMGRQSYIDDLAATVELLYNSPALAAYTAFNEGWGQFDCDKATALIRKLDGTRITDSTSGWHDERRGDVRSRHVYFKPYHFKLDKLKNRPVVLSEFGGYSQAVGGHSYSDRIYGYKKFASPHELTEAYTKLYVSEIIPAIGLGLCAAFYTQLTDVEEETNGIMTFDRRIVKMDEGAVRTINSKMKYVR